MLRVKDVTKSLKFYDEILGMDLKKTVENKDSGFNLYFLGYGPAVSEDKAGKTGSIAGREGLLELTWNYGTEKEPDFKYHDGNSDPKGFGHICISVDDLDAACHRFERLGVDWKKKLTDGRMKDIAFVLGTAVSPWSLSSANTQKTQMATGLSWFKTRQSKRDATGERNSKNG